MPSASVYGLGASQDRGPSQNDDYDADEMKTLLDNPGEAVDEADAAGRGLDADDRVDRARARSSTSLWATITSAGGRVPQKARPPA